MPRSSDVVIVIPTLGERVDFLRQTIESILDQTPQPIVRMVVPPQRTEAIELARSVGAEVIDDPGSLPSAINRGLSDLPDGIRFVGWLGDDDLLADGAMDATWSALDRESSAVLAYGACGYIDDKGQPLWTSRAGRHAQWILPWGPDLIPQPGMLVRARAWRDVGGLDESLRFAFDLDLLLKLRAVGGFVDVGSVVSMFRWHPDSLTVSDRTASLDESEAVKRRYLSRRARRWSWLWERPVRGATRVAAWEVTRRANAKTKPARPT